MKLTALLAAAFLAYALGSAALSLPYALWLLVWAALIGLLCLIGRWVV